MKTVSYTALTNAVIQSLLLVQASAVENISSEFATLVTSPTFIDKSVMIKTFLENDNFTLITAPPKFGKTSNLQMIKSFMELEVTCNGLPITENNYLEDPVNDTDNYRLFMENNLKISKFPDLFHKHFGKTPVVYVDFKNEQFDGNNITITCMYDIVRVCKEVVHRSMSEHKYLRISARLTEDHRQYVHMWTDQHSYKTMIDSLYVSHGLQSLAQYLHMHFLRRVMVLVDNYDYLLRLIVSQVSDSKEALRMVRYVVSIIKDLVVDSDDHIQGAIITGISVLPFLNYTDFNHCRIYRFLGDHSYVGFYGVVDEDVNTFLDKSEFKIVGNKNNVVSYCGGYVSENGKQVINLFSFLTYLKTGTFKHHLNLSTSDLVLLKSLHLHLDVFQDELHKLLQGEVFGIVDQVRVSVDNIVNIYKITDRCKVTSYMLNNLQDLGFLTFISRSPDINISERTNTVKLANNESKTILAGFLKKVKCKVGLNS